MTVWQRLERELDIWFREGRTATFWWRDDDACRPTRQLRRLFHLANRFEVPVAIAVVPARLEHSLPPFLEKHQRITVLQHGWVHRNHAPENVAKNEFCSGRSRSVVHEELRAGLNRFRDQFPVRRRDVLVPPWGRIDAELIPTLRDLGFTGISIGGPRTSECVDNLRQINVHAEIVDWPKLASVPRMLRWAWRARLQLRHEASSFIGTGNAIDQVLRHLRARRTGEVDQTEPTGLLTHHLAHDERCWAFVKEFLARTQRHPGAQWLDAESLFPV